MKLEAEHPKLVCLEVLRWGLEGLACIRGCSKPCFTTILTFLQSNILVDATGHARITDFGGATIIQGPGSTQSVSDNPDHAVQWAAPESARGGGM